MSKKLSKKKKRRIRRVVTRCSLLLLLLIVIISSISLFVGAKKLYAQAQPVLSELKAAKQNISKTTSEDINKLSDDLEPFLQKTGKFLKKPSVRVLSILPFFRQYIRFASKAVDLSSNAVSSLLRPIGEIIDDYPIKDLAVDGGYRVGNLIPYVDLLSDNIELVDSAVELIAKSKVPLLNKVMNYDGIKDSCISFSENSGDLANFILFAKAFLGDGSDKVYFLAVQNSAEIRASGGFIGSMAPIYITDGVLSFGEFDSWYPYMTYGVDGVTYVSPQEYNLFSYGVAYPRDEGYNPDFTRVAEVWSDSYAYMRGYYFDGVVSINPPVLQELLRYSDGFYLSDGSYIDGNNATKVLQYDLYYYYQSAYTDASANNAYVDSLFAEAADNGMSAIMNDLNLDKILGYYEVFKKCSADRNIMIWMADPEEEALVEKLGCSGALNSDPEKPEVGVYFSCCDPGRLGLFLEMDTMVSEPTVNKDGSRSYDVTVRYNNNMTDWEYYNGGSSWIVGHYGGNIRCYVHYFAPAGGSLDNFQVPDGMYLNWDEYKGLEVAYNLDMIIYRGSPFEVKFTVTTAPGVDTPLKVSSTPVLYEYLYPHE